MSDPSLSYLSIGSLGTGFLESSLDRGLEYPIDFIGADAGSADGGPGALSGSTSGWPRANYKRDLSLLVRGALSKNVPLIVGSCGMSGRDWGVDLFAELAREIADEHGLSFRMARIYSELQPDLVVDHIRADRLRPIEPAPHYDEEVAANSARIVGVMGVEPIQEALRRGADIVLAGRTTDTAIFAAIPLSRGFPPGPVWHAAKVAECGTGAAEPRRRLDVLHIELEGDSFVAQPMAEDLRCTPFSVAGNQLHEVADPYTLIEPGWRIDLRETNYAAVTDRATRVTGSAAERIPYTMKLEGVEHLGSQQMFLFSVRDPTILEALDGWTTSIEADVAGRIEEILGAGVLDQCVISIRTYGRNGTMGSREPIDRFEGHEACFVVDVIAPDAPTCETVTSVLWYAMMHAKSPGWRGGVTVAWPFTRQIFDVGEAYRFNVHHAIELDDPLEPLRIETEEVSP